jgi:hypothetical protein
MRRTGYGSTERLRISKGMGGNGTISSLKLAYLERLSLSK